MVGLPCGFLYVKMLIYNSLQSVGRMCRLSCEIPFLCCMYFGKEPGYQRIVMKYVIPYTVSEILDQAGQFDLAGVKLFERIVMQDKKRGKLNRKNELFKNCMFPHMFFFVTIWLFVSKNIFSS